MGNLTSYIYKETCEITLKVCDFLKMFYYVKRILGLLPLAASACRKLQYLVLHISKFAGGEYPRTCLAGHSPSHFSPPSSNTFRCLWHMRRYRQSGKFRLSRIECTGECYCYKQAKVSALSNWSVDRWSVAGKRKFHFQLVRIDHQWTGEVVQASGSYSARGVLLSRLEGATDQEKTLPTLRYVEHWKDVTGINAYTIVKGTVIQPLAASCLSGPYRCCSRVVYNHEMSWTV